MDRFIFYCMYLQKDVETVRLIETVRLYINSLGTRAYGAFNRDTPKILPTVRLIEQYA